VALPVADTAAQSPKSVAGLADLLGEGSPPEDPRAESFRDAALALLDDVSWVPLEAGQGVPELSTPKTLLVEARDDLITKVVGAFDPGYVMRRTSRGVPSRATGETGHQFLTQRRPEDAPDIWDSVALPCRPGPSGPWALARNAPSLVFADCDVEKALDALSFGAFLYAGRLGSWRDRDGRPRGWDCRRRDHQERGAEFGAKNRLRAALSCPGRGP
jgi:hypothetical protein